MKTGQKAGVGVRQTDGRALTNLDLQPKLFSTPQQQVTTDDYFTPPWLFERMAAEFDVDVAAPPGGVPWIPTATYLTQADDGLAQDWHGVVWMNPPFSNPLPWIRRFIRHNNGIALVPTSNGKWQDELWNSQLSWVTLPAIKFHTPTGPARGTLPNRCWLVASTDMAHHLQAFGRTR